MNPTEKGFVERWSDIISSVEKTLIPIEYVKRVRVNNTDDETPKTIDIEEMKERGLTRETIESIYYDSLFGEKVDDIDFYVDINAVARTVQRETNKLLNLDQDL